MADKRKRRNIMMLDLVYEVAQGLMRERHMGDRKFSEFLSDLVMETRERRASGDDKAPKQYLAEMLELLAKNRALEAKVEALKGEKAAMKTVWKRHLAEERKAIHGPAYEAKD